MPENHSSGRKKVRRAAWPSVFIVLFLILSASALPKKAASAAALDTEENAVLAAARDFLEAELNQDYPAVYESFAPSSPYAREHCYDTYYKESAALPDRLVDYRIIAVTYIQDNENRDAWPTVEKFAQVEVDMVFLHMPTERRTEINIGFIFMKEGGRWYKS